MLGGERGLPQLMPTPLPTRHLFHAPSARARRPQPTAVPCTWDVVALVLARQFGVEYQPIVELRTGRTVGHEALSRFDDPAGREIAAASVFACLHDEPTLLLFVEAETTRFQIDQAPPGALYLNIDPNSFQAGARADHNPLLELLAARQGETVVEVIEALDVADARLSRGLVDALRAIGIGVALDDVGAPDALISLEALKEADVLKLDRTWLDRIHQPRDRAVLESLLGLARRLGSRTILEGVETPRHLALAEGLGVDAVQGFLFRDRFVLRNAS
jgi:EAL domain-containing protein (putative c-di-GMP-specific phosphodiesterase class I)